MLIEKQKFLNPWAWLVVIAGLGFFSWAFISQVFYAKTIGNNPAPSFLLGFSALVFLCLVIFFVITFLEVRVDQNTIYLRYYPFVMRKYSFDDIKSLELVKYNPLRDFGGWGIRVNGRETAYTMGGHYGIKIELMVGGSILIGVKDRLKYKPLINYQYGNNQKI